MHTPRTTGAIAESRTLQLGFASILIAFIAVILVSGSLGIPHEDSSIIYSYAENLATTGVISYSPGGERAEGATPFLWMVCLALLHILGVGTHLAAAILNALAVLAFHTFWRHAAAADSTIVKGSATLATVVFFTPMFASGAVGAGLAGFSTVAFCTLIAITFLSACLRVNSRLAVIALILLPLVRPDGLMFLVAIVASVILFEFAVLLVARFDRSACPLSLRLRLMRLLTDLLRSRSYLLTSIAASIAVFAAYWSVRWLYFGRPFPLPYYVKSEPLPLHEIFMAAAREIVTNDYNSVVIVLIVLGALVVLTRVDMTRRLPTVFLCAAATALSVIALGNIFYSRYILSQNICDRFHAPFVAIGACCFVVALFGQLQEQESTARARRASTILIICSWLLSAHVSSMAGGGVKSSLDRLRISVEEARNNNIWRLASDLRPYQMDGEQRSQLLVTEAGRIAYYSKFDTIDAWGLNSPQYSESPLDDPAEVARIAPLIINIHGYPLLPSYSYLNAPTKDAGPPQRDWVRMTQAIFKGAVASRAYSVFAVPFSVDGTALNGDRFDLILVRADRPHTQDIEAVILAHRGEALGRADLIGQEVLAKYRP